MSNNIQYQLFLAVFGCLAGKVPVVDDVLSSDEQKVHLTTSLDEYFIKFEFQTYRSYYFDLSQTYPALKLKLVKGRGSKTYDTKEVTGEQKKGKSG